MNMQIDYETERELGIDYEALAVKVADKVLEMEECPYDAQVNLVLTDNEEIKRVNTEFVNVLDRHTAQMRVWERGSGETLACGTGACAVAVACALNGLTEDEVTVKLLGGDLQIKWDREKNTVYMTGPAEVVFDGEWK